MFLRLTDGVRTIENEKSIYLAKSDRYPVIFVNLKRRGKEKTDNVMAYSTNGSYSHPLNMDLYHNFRGKD